MMRSPASASDIKRPAAKFDPFSNRLSRDIRNTLSEAFMDALAQMEPAAYRVQAEAWLAKNPAEIFGGYIQDRLKRYDQVLAQIKASQLDQHLLQCLVIWNKGLFFEFHEHLEEIWTQAIGDERQALKGLIQAAGVYIHNEFGHQQAVASLAAKSYRLIQQYSHCLAFVENLDVLLQKLKRLDLDPPRLENSALSQD